MNAARLGVANVCIKGRIPLGADSPRWFAGDFLMALAWDGISVFRLALFGKNGTLSTPDNSWAGEHSRHYVKHYWREAP